MNIIKNSSPLWNNAFSYEKRKSLWSDCTIYVPSLISGDLNDLKIWNQIVFEEIDSKWNLSSHVWLQNFLHISKSGKGIFITDNHNHALYFRFQSYFQKTISAPISLIHIDQHTDMNDNENIFSLDSDLDQISDFVNYECNVWNFIKPSIQSWLISEIQQINTEYKILNFDTDIQSDFILDIDIDFRHPDMNIEKYQETIDKTRELISKAKLVTIATSPFFIDQNLAIKITKDLLI